MKLSDYVADFLSREVKHVFSGQGGVVIHLNDSIARHKKLRLVPCENEQCASIAAEAYARVTRKLGVAIATSGPGMINLMQGIACAYYDSIPSLFISGASPVNHLKGGLKVRQYGFQEMDVVKIVESITKYAVLVTDAKKIRYELEKLVYMAREGRPGPVLLDLPDDLQRAEIHPDELESFIPPAVPAREIKNEIAAFKSMLAASSRPVLVVGGGVKLARAEKLIDVLVKKTGLPILTTWSTIDLFTESNPNLVGNFGISANRYGNFAVQTADLVISIGARLDTHEAGSDAGKFAVKAKKIMVDIDESELTKFKNMRVDLAINCEIKYFLEQLLREDLKTRSIEPWKKHVRALKKKYPVCCEEYFAQKKCVNPYVFMDELSRQTAKGDIVVTDAGGTLTWTMQGYKIRKPQSLFSAFNHSPMGYSICAVVGAQFAAPKNNVICITGDGGLNMNLQELETIIFNKLPVKIFVLDNGEYGIIKQTQDTWMQSHYVGTDETCGLGFPDLKKVAAAYGYTVVEIADHKTLSKKIRAVLAMKGKPVFCRVKVQSGQKILPKLVFGKPIEDQAPLLDREELRKILDVENLK